MTIWVGAENDCEVWKILNNYTSVWSTHLPRTVLVTVYISFQAGNGVFDLEQFAATHPGGANAIRRNCGKTVTNWATKSAGHQNFMLVTTRNLVWL